MDKYADFVFDDVLVSPVNGYKTKKITLQNIKQFGFLSIDNFLNQYPDFPLMCKNTMLKYKTSYDKNISKRMYLRNLAEYNKNPFKCKREECPNLLSYEQKKARNKFCCSSCSGLVNNKGKVNNPKGIGLANRPKKIVKKTVKLKCYLCNKNIIKLHENGDFVHKECYRRYERKKRYQEFKENNPNPIKITEYLKISIINVLNKDYSHIEDIQKLREVIKLHLFKDMMTPNEIKKMYNLPYQNIHDLISSILKIPTRTLLETQKLLHERRKDNLDEKAIYYLECQFLFDVYKYPKIIGYDLLQRYCFTPANTKFKNRGNKLFLHRDHMISISYGWKNNIPSRIISHPANCHIMFEKDNMRKGDGISITLDELKERIEKWDNDVSYIPEQMILQPSRLPKSDEHKRSISRQHLGKKCIMMASKIILYLQDALQSQIGCMGY